MRNWLCALNYVGTDYAGWQRQPQVASVQAEVEKAISAVANEQINTVCAGRTDKGVHANQQIINFSSQANRSANQWVAGANTHLPSSIRLMYAQTVSRDFSARFSARSRWYQYRIYIGECLPAVLHDRALLHRQPLNCDVMQQVGSYWLGENDFSSFRGSGCQAAHARRRLLQWQVQKTATGIVINVCANAFLQHMVRNMVGTAIAVGSGQKSVSWARDVMLARDRTKAAAMAPASGLYLHAVYYPSASGVTLPNAIDVFAS